MVDMPSKDKEMVLLFWKKLSKDIGTALKEYLWWNLDVSSYRTMKTWLASILKLIAIPKDRNQIMPP